MNKLFFVGFMVVISCSSLAGVGGVVVKGVAHQTDSRTFFEVKKARAYVKKNMADNKVADNNVQNPEPRIN